LLLELLTNPFVFFSGALAAMLSFFCFLSQVRAPKISSPGSAVDYVTDFFGPPLTDALAAGVFLFCCCPSLISLSSICLIISYSRGMVFSI
jgi:hypothetical protein